MRQEEGQAGWSQGSLEGVTFPEAWSGGHRLYSGDPGACCMLLGYSVHPAGEWMVWTWPWLSAERMTCKPQ